ncbi:MAG: ABC transporter substrate-binding protein, partial [Clostridia bacterium]|nr:ABC transporter substrate-binding protein [Clostridia bacterium]
MKKWLMMALCLMLALNGAGALAEQQAVTIDNNDRTTSYEAAPERVVALSYSNAELLAALGLEDKVVAIFPGMYVLDDVSAEYRETVAAMPLITEGLNRGTPNLETILDQEPDFVLGTYYNFKATSCGTPEDFETMGAHTYANEGTYVSGATLENTYNDILNLGKIFRVEERAEALVASMREQEAEIREKCAALEPVSVFVYDSGE